MKGYRKYFGKKFLWFAITFVVAVILNFFLPRMMPVDPVSAITGKMAQGMTDASAVQEIYKRWLPISAKASIRSCCLPSCSWAMCPPSVWPLCC